MLKETLGLWGGDYLRVTPALFAYLFQRISHVRFLEIAGSRTEGTRIVDSVRNNGYVLKHCKCYAYACHYARLQGQPFPRSSDYGVAAADAVLLRKLNLGHIDPKFMPWTIQQFDEQVVKVLNSPELKTYVGKFISKKMSFLIKSYGADRYEIQQSLMATALYALYKLYPQYESELHFVNIAKNNIKFAGQTFISSQVAQSRQCLRENEQGDMESVLVPMDAVTHQLEAPVSYGADLKEQLLALSQIEHRLSVRVQQFLLCVGGQYDEGLSRYLQQPNDALAVQNYNRYLKMVYKYFNTTPEQVGDLYARIRNQIYSVDLGAATS